MPPKKGPAYSKKLLIEDAMRIFDDHRRSQKKFTSKQLGDRWFKKWNQNAWQREKEAARNQPFVDFKTATATLKSMRQGYYPYKSAYSKHQKKK